MSQKTQTAIIGVGVILAVKQKVLMLKGKTGDHWTFVGGKIEEGETPLQTCIRETNEEIGITLTDLELEDVFFRWGWSNADLLVGILYSSTLPSMPESFSVKQDEITDYAWVERGSLDNYNIPNDQRLVLERYFKKIA